MLSNSFTPENLKHPFINMYEDSSLMKFIIQDFLIDEIYKNSPPFVHYQFTAQNMNLHIVSRDIPHIAIT